MQNATLAATRGAGDETIALRLAGGFGALVVLTFGLIVLGALVRANDAGLACPDWPLCFGEFVPRMDLRVGFEWGHRVIAGFVGLAFVTLGTLALRRAELRAVCAPLLGVAALLLALQVLLGALTVWQLLASWTVTAHLLTGNAFAASLLWMALLLRDHGRGAAPALAASARARAVVSGAALLLALQMLLGGLVASSYAGLACPDFPTCREGLWLPTFEGAVGLQLLHRINGAALVVGLVLAALATRGEAPLLRRAAQVALGLGLAQVCVGAANVLLRLPVEVTGLHSALAAALVLTATVALRESWAPRAS
ncbi:MAG: COX15/CtaA family protein [Myxococcota bacterium]|nr:COX15/CtaA family protein [Myxococcota bacterium]